MKIQPLHSSSLPAYNTDPKARARLAAALGLAASLGLSACNDEPLGGDIAAPDTTAVSSSSATAGMPEYSSSSSKDTLTPITEPLSGDIAWVDTATAVDSVFMDSLVSEPTAGVIVVPADSSFEISSSSQDTAEPLPEDSVFVDTLIIEPLAGVIMQPVYPYPQSSSSVPSSSSAVSASSAQPDGE